MTIPAAARGLATLAILPFLAAPLVAQEGDAVFSETIDVNIVNIEVIVTDKAGEPVTGLTRDDFEIFEDGKPMALTNFYAVDQPAMSLGEGDVPGQEESSRPAGATQGLNLIVFIDNLNIHPTNRKLLFEKLRARLSEDTIPGSQIMLATMNNRVEVALGFTNDMQQIFATLDEIEKQTSIYALLDSERSMFMSRLGRASTRGMNCNRTRPPGGPGGGGGGGIQTDPSFDNAIRDAQDLAQTVRTLGEQRYQAARTTVGSLAAFSDTLGGLPGRKAMLYLSDGIPMRPADSISEAWIAKYDQWFQQNENAIRNCSRYPEAVADLQRAMTGSSSSNFDLRTDFNRLTARASDNRVAFYPVSNSGRNASFVSAANPGSSDGGSSQMMRGAMMAEATSRDAGLLQIAEETGGEAFTGNANIGELVNRADRDATFFYSLGYTPPEREPDNSFHKIEVKVKRDDVKTRHIKGYHQKTWRDRLGDMAVAAALYDLESNPHGIQLQPGETVKEGNRYKVPVMVQIPFKSIQMVSDGDTYKANLSLLVVVRDNKGGFSQPRRFDLPIEIPNAQILAARQQTAAYPLELELKKGDQRVAVGLRDHVGQTASCLKLDFDFGGSSEKAKGKKGKKGKKSRKG